MNGVSERRELHVREASMMMHDPDALVAPKEWIVCRSQDYRRMLNINVCKPRSVGITPQYLLTSHYL